MRKILMPLIPTTALFASPWMHKALFLNMKTAIPDMDAGLAHTLAVIGAGLALWLSLWIYFEVNKRDYR